MIPGDSTEVEMIETEEVVSSDFFVERHSEGVVLTIAGDDRAEDIACLFTVERAREMSDILFSVSCQEAPPE